MMRDVEACRDESVYGTAIVRLAHLDVGGNALAIPVRAKLEPGVHDADNGGNQACREYSDEQLSP